jgi:hypothetical protein
VARVPVPSKRWWLVVAVAILAGAVLRISESDTAHDIAVPLGLVDDPPFAVHLSGELWADRTLHDSEGAPDVALVAADEPLRASIRATGRAPIAALELRVNGHVQRRVVPACCPHRLTVSFLPRLNSRAPGSRRIEVVVRDAAGLKAGAETGAHVSAAGLTLRVVRRLPSVVEAEAATLPPRAPPGAALAAPGRRAALQLFGEARRTGSLRALLGSTPVGVRAAGTLRDGSRIIGATLFLTLGVPQTNVSALVPAYVPGHSSAGPYEPRPVSMSAGRLSDLLVDLDLTKRRVIAVEPGPSSVTKFWSATDPSAKERLGADVDTVSDTAARLPRLVKASNRGPAFLAYDGSLSLNPRERDWAVSLLFAGNATIDNVKDGLRKVGFTRRGGTHYLAYRLPDAGLRFDSDRGLKTNCDAAGTDVHLRMYAPAGVDHFQDPQFGRMVVATAHLDHADNCGPGTPRFGFSGVAERRVAAAAARLGWRVQRDALLLGNTEPYRRDVRDPSHIWLGNGRATVIWVP